MLPLYGIHQLRRVLCISGDPCSSLPMLRRDRANSLALPRFWFTAASPFHPCFLKQVRQIPWSSFIVLPVVRYRRSTTLTVSPPLGTGSQARPSPWTNSERDMIHRSSPNNSPIPPEPGNDKQSARLENTAAGLKSIGVPTTSHGIASEQSSSCLLMHPNRFLRGNPGSTSVLHTIAHCI